MSKVKLKDVCTKASSSIAQKDLDGCDGAYPIYGASGLIKYVDFYKQDKPYIAVVKDGAGIGRVMLLPAKSSVIGTMQYIIPNSNINASYLSYALEKMNLAKYYTGATIPHIYFKDYCKEKLPNHASFEQQQIADILDKASNLIAKRKQQLEKLDLLVKSCFVEMFGDPEINPFGFEIVMLKDVCSSIVRGPFGSALKKEFFVEKSNDTYKVYEQKNAIQKKTDIGTYYITKEKFNELKRFECKPDDIIMSCSGTMGELYQLPYNSEKGIINQALCKFTLNNKILPIVFLTYMKETIGNLETKGSGIKNIAAVSYVKEMKLILPPLELQNQFADFVTATEQQKEKIKKSLETLETLKASLMQKYFG